MKNIFLLALSFFILTSASQKENFNSIFDNYYNEAKGRGNGVCVIILKGSDTLFSRSQGDIQATTVIPIASASKWLSATVIMALVDDGKLSLDDSIGKFLPNLSAEKRGLTFRHCFSHSSGMPGKNFMAKGLNNRNISMDDCVKDIDANFHPEHKQGEAFEYGGLSMQLAGHAAEIAGGMLFSDLLKKYVTDPLDMKNTSFNPASSATTNPMIAGGIKSCANDYLHFLQMLLNKGMYNGKRILSEKSLNEMLKNEIPENALIIKSPFDNSNNATLKNEKARYGIGNWCEIYDPATGIPDLSSSPGLFGFTPWYDEKHGIIGVISVLSSYQKGGGLYVAMREEADKE